jgi:F0F1-type ATP synthase assembly protein I
MFLLSIRRAATLQIGLIGLVVLAMLVWKGGELALAAGYGGLAAVLNSAMLYWRWVRGTRRFHSDPERHLRSFYRSSLERFMMVGLWMAAGLAWIGLAPLALVVGFVAGQLAWLIASPTLRERT